MARVFVMFDNNSHGEGRAALVDAALARMRLANEIPYLVTVDDVHGFLEASARPVPTWRVMLNPATVGGARDTRKGFVKTEAELRVMVLLPCVVSVGLFLRLQCSTR